MPVHRRAVWKVLAVAHHEGPHVIVKALILSAGEEAVGQPAGGLLPEVMHSSQAAGDVSARRHLETLELVIL